MHTGSTWLVVVSAEVLIRGSSCWSTGCNSWLHAWLHSVVSYTTDTVGILVRKRNPTPLST